MKTFHDPEAFARVRRLPPFAPAASARLREAATARGVDVIDLSAEDADPGAPAAAVERLQAAVADPRLHAAVDPRGLPELRQAASRWWKRRHGVDLDPDREVLVTLGSTDALAHALVALLADGETVLAPTPASPVHLHAASLAGAEPVLAPVGAGVDFFDSIVEANERAEKRPKGLLIAFPSNPTGAVATPELLDKLVRFAEARGMFVLSDLAQHELVYDGGRAPAALAVGGARERALEVVSLSAGYGMGGFRVGFCAGNAALVAALARVKSYVDRGVFAPVQLAAAAALDACDGDVAERRARLERRRDALVRTFRGAGWAIPAPPATAFAWAPIPEPFRALGSAEFARRLLDEAGVAVAPGAIFGDAGEGFVRLSLSADEPGLARAAERIEAFLAKGPGGRPA